MHIGPISLILSSSPFIGPFFGCYNIAMVNIAMVTLKVTQSVDISSSVAFTPNEEGANAALFAMVGVATTVASSIFLARSGAISRQSASLCITYSLMAGVIFADYWQNFSFFVKI